MAFKTSELLNGGCVNVYKLKGNGNYVLVLVFTDRVIVTPLLTIKGLGNVAYVPDATVLKVDEATGDKICNNIEDFLKTTFHTVYPKLPKFNYVKQKAAPTHDMIVEGFVQGRGDKAEDAIVEKALTDAGYDVSALNKKICASTKERDYTDLMKKPEAQERYDLVEELVKKIDGKVATCDMQIKIAYEAIKQGKTNGLILTGPAGTGKSVATYIMSHEMGAPLITYQASEGMQVEDMIGEFKPSEDPDKQFEFVLGLLLKAYSEGYQMLIDEVNTAPAGILSIINQFMDDTPSITQKGVVYKRDPNFVLYMTLNPGYEGTQIMNQALKSRFMKVVVKNLAKEEFVYRMVTYSKNRCGCQLGEDFYGKLYDFGPVVSTKASNLGESVAICIRNAQQLTDAITTHSMNYDEFNAAINMSYLNNLYMDNDNLANLLTYQKDANVQQTIKELFELYNYKVIKSVKVTVSYDDIAEEAPATTGTASGKGKRAVDDFEDDEIDALDSMDDDNIVSSLQDEIDEAEAAEAEAEENAKAKAKGETETEDEEEESEDIDDEEEVNE